MIAKVLLTIGCFALIIAISSIVSIISIIVIKHATDILD